MKSEENAKISVGLLMIFVISLFIVTGSGCDVLMEKLKVIL